MAAEEYFGIRLDTDKLEQDAQQAKKAFDDIAEEAQKAGKVIDKVSEEAGKAVNDIAKETAKAGEVLGSSLGDNVVSTAKKFDTLGFSLQQIARELPSLTLSPQMFFLAISNNLPMFTDALAQAKKEYQELTAAGQKAIPVWKQVTKAILSWQTGISLLPTLLILYGDKIGEFFSKLGKGTDQINKAKTALEELKAINLLGAQDAQKEVVALNLVYSATQDVTKSLDERKAAVNKLQEEYPSFFQNMTDEEVLAGKAAGAYERLTNSIVASSRARAAQDKMIENAKQILDNEQKINDAYAKREQLQTELEAQYKRIAQIESVTADPTALRGNQQLTAARAKGVSIADEIADLDKQIASYRRGIYELNKVQTDLAKNINIQDLIFDPKEGTGKEGKGKKAVNNLKQYLNELLGLQEDNEDRIVEAMKEGTEKQIAEINLRYSREIAAVKKLQEELKKEQGGKLTTDQQAVFDTAITGIGKAKDTAISKLLSEQAAAERSAMQTYLAEYGNYWEKRQAIAQQYQDKISKATTEGERLSLQAGMVQALAKLDDEAQKKTSIITKLFGDMSKKTVADMRSIANEAEKMLSFIEGGQYDKDNSFGITEEQFKVLSQSPEKLESIKNEIANVRNEADQAEPAFEKIKNLLNDIFKNGGKDNNKLQSNLASLNNEVGKVMQSVSFLSNAFSDLGDAFGGGAFSSIAEGLNVAMGAVNSAMQGAQAGSLFGPIGAAAGAAVGLVTSLASSIAKIHDKKNEEEIQRLQEQIDVLSRNYDKLGDAIENAYSKDASELIEQQNTMLEQQKVLIQQQIKEEQDKKKTDEGRIKEWEQQIEDINDLIEENKEKAVDAIFGEDVQSAIERFSSSVTDMWAKNTNASQSARDAVKQMMQQMVTESIKSLIKTSGKMEEIRKKLQEFYADEVLTGWEQDYIYNMADQLQEEIDRKYGWAEGLFKDKDATQTATSKGFETMTQDQAGELSGRFTALVEIGLRQEQQINIGNVNLESIRDTANETRDIVQNCYLELVEIRENTGAVVKPIQQMQKDMQEMNKTIKEKL